MCVNTIVNDIAVSRAPSSDALFLSIQRKPFICSFLGFRLLSLRHVISIWGLICASPLLVQPYSIAAPPPLRRVELLSHRFQHKSMQSIFPLAFREECYLPLLSRTPSTALLLRKSTLEKVLCTSERRKRWRSSNWWPFRWAKKSSG